MMSAEIGRETTTYSSFPTKNVSAIAPAETTYDWSNTVTWTVSNTTWDYDKSYLTIELKFVEKGAAA